MPNFPSLKSFASELDNLVTGMDRGTKMQITRPMAERAVSLAESAASADLGGDPKFSGWKPVLDTKIKYTSDGAAIVHPSKTSAGPWTVAEFGRNQGNASGFSGPGINTRTGKTSRTKSGGLRKVRTRASKRWNGTTRGKGTATSAIAAMDRELPPIAAEGFRKMLKRHFDVT